MNKVSWMGVIKYKNKDNIMATYINNRRINSSLNNTGRNAKGNVETVCINGEMYIGTTRRGNRGELYVNKIKKVSNNYVSASDKALMEKLAAKMAS